MNHQYKYFHFLTLKFSMMTMIMVLVQVLVLVVVFNRKNDHCVVDAARPRPRRLGMNPIPPTSFITVNRCASCNQGHGRTHDIIKFSHPAKASSSPFTILSPTTTSMSTSTSISLASTLMPTSILKSKTKSTTATALALSSASASASSAPIQQRRKQTKIEKANEAYKEKRLKKRLNRKYRALQEKINGGTNGSASDGDGDGDGDSTTATATATATPLTQKECDDLLGICAAANDWEKYDYVIQVMNDSNANNNGGGGGDDGDDDDDHKGEKLSLQKSSLRSCLKECYTVGNGLSSIKIFDSTLAIINQQEQEGNERNDRGRGRVGEGKGDSDGDGDNDKELLFLEGQDIDLVVGALCKQNNWNDGSLWQKALEVLYYAAEHRGGNIRGDNVKVESYNNVLLRMEVDKDWNEAMKLLSLMEQSQQGKDIEKSQAQAQVPTTPSTLQHTPPNLATYHNVLNVLIASDQLEEASTLLQSLSSSSTSKQPPQSNVIPTTYTFEIVLAALTKNDRRGTHYKEAIQLLDTMVQLNIRPTVEMYNRVISSCAKAKKAQDAMLIYDQMKKRKIQPDTVTYNSLISACANQGLANDAFKLFNECKKDANLRPDVITYTNTIRACGRARMSRRALQLLTDAKKESIPLDVFLYTAVIDACGKDKEWRIALNLLNDMKTNSIIANQYTYSAVINALGNSGQWERAVEIKDQMKERGMKVNVVTYNSVIAALAKASRGKTSSSSDMEKGQLWVKAMKLLNEMKSERVWPDKYSYSSAITCCASGGRYQEAIDLIKIMRNGPSKIRPNRISYTGAMTACSKAGEWSHALRLFIDMKTDRIKCDVVAYNALVSAFVNGGKPNMAYEVWNKMCGIKERGQNLTGINIDLEENVQPDIITLTNVIACLERAEGKESMVKMDQVFRDAVERQIILSDDSMDTTWEIDLSGMSLPVARAACRFIMNRLLGSGGDPEDLMLITGVGKRHQQEDPETSGGDVVKPSRTALREYVRQILREDFDPPLYSKIPSYAAGTVQIDKEIMKKWMDNCTK